MASSVVSSMPGSVSHEDAHDAYGFRETCRHGDIWTYLSFVVLGLGNVMRGQIVKGLCWLLVEAAFIAFMIVGGVPSIVGLWHLDTGGKLVNVIQDGFSVATTTAPSYVMLLYGMASLFIVVMFVAFWWFAVRSAYRAQVLAKRNGTAPSIVEDLRDLTDRKAQNSLMSLPVLGILVFTVMPLVYMISMAFTGYGPNGNPNYVSTFGWVGLRNFKTLFSNQSGLSVNLHLFIQVAIWTLVWAFFATFLNYFLGMFIAMLINRPGIRFKGFWRSVFAMSIAVPQFVSLLVMNLMLGQSGIVNNLLMNAHWISSPLPFWSNPMWARITVIVINLWIGIPFTIMQVTGILQNIPAELYEAARVDGANAWQLFRSVTMPYMFFVMTPYLITTFVGNVNNFNVIYLLTGGGPTPTGQSAGATDLLITWIYSLSIDKGNYSMASVIGIFTFIVLAVISLVTYRSSASYKNEGGFQ
ncbi:sugar ABC transporter permease [Bifidobacterium mongoliense]